MAQRSNTWDFFPWSLGEMECGGVGICRIVNEQWTMAIIHLVGGLDHFLFFHILEIVIPTDFHIFQRG